MITSRIHYSTFTPGFKGSLHNSWLWRFLPLMSLPPVLYKPNCVDGVSQVPHRERERQEASEAKRGEPGEPESQGSLMAGAQVLLLWQSPKEAGNLRGDVQGEIVDPELSPPSRSRNPERKSLQPEVTQHRQDNGCLRGNTRTDDHRLRDLMLCYCIRP